MMIIETWTNCIGATPPDLCAMVLSAAFFLLSGKSLVCIRSGKILAVKFSDTQGVGGAYKQEDFMCESSKYFSSHMHGVNNPLSRLGLMPLSM